MKLRNLFIILNLLSTKLLISQDNFYYKSDSFIGACSQLTRDTKIYNPFSIHEQLLDSLSSANIRFTRTGFKWKFIHPQKGIWDWRVTDQVVKSARIKNVSILGLIGGIPDYVRDAPLNHVELWLEYVDSLSKRYSKDIYHWEIWNEPNVRSGKYWPQNELPNTFVKYVIEASKIIKKNQPNAFILLGGLATGNKARPFEVWQSMFELGILDFVDGVAYHSYKHPGTQLIDFNSRLNTLISKFTGKEKELWITEFGVPAVSSVGSGKFSYQYQKDQILKSALVHWATGGEKFFIFSLWNKVKYDKKLSKKKIRENKKGYYGLLEKDMSQKPSYKSIKWLNNIFSNYTQHGLIVNGEKVIIKIQEKKSGNLAFLSWGGVKHKDIIMLSKDSKIVTVESFERIRNAVSANKGDKKTFDEKEVLFWH